MKDRVHSGPMSACDLNGSFAPKLDVGRLRHASRKRTLKRTGEAAPTCGTS